MEKAWSLALWCVLVCYNTGYRVGKLKGLPSRRKGIMNMARYHYTRENENGVVLYLESEPAEDAMDSEDELSMSLRESEERLDGLRWQLRTSPESSRREVRG